MLINKRKDKNILCIINDNTKKKKNKILNSNDKNVIKDFLAARKIDNLEATDKTNPISNKKKIVRKRAEEYEKIAM